jgi:hypothetical protein
MPSLFELVVRHYPLAALTVSEKLCTCKEEQLPPLVPTLFVALALTIGEEFKDLWVL